MFDTLKTMQGIIGVINTPFTDANTIDQESLRRYVDHSIHCGVVGFLVLGLAAEVYKLSLDEKTLIVHTVLNQVNQRVPVIAGTAASTQEERILLAEQFSQMGCEGILINIPFEEEQHFIRQVTAVSKHIRGFMMLQDWDFHGYGIPVPSIESLFTTIDCFKCLKIEVAPAGVKYTELREHTSGKLHLSGGWAGTQMIEALDRGVDAFMPTILQDVYTRIYRLHSQGKRSEGKALFEKLLPIIAFSHQHPDIAIHFNKRLIYKQGIFSTPQVRKPILPFDAYHEKVAAELIEEAITLSKETLKQAKEDETA
jgi:dihydrodipicolinate synthase/N-acetylneuraminate lyase